MTDSLQKVGLYVDDQNEIRLIDPSIYQKSVALRDLSDNFRTKNGDFQESVSTFVDSLSKIADKVEQEKFKAIGSRSLIKTLEMEKDTTKEQYRNLIREKKLEMERTRLEYESLKRQELEQQSLLQILRQLKR